MFSINNDYSSSTRNDLQSKWSFGKCILVVFYLCGLVITIFSLITASSYSYTEIFIPPAKNPIIDTIIFTYILLDIQFVFLFVVLLICNWREVATIWIKITVFIAVVLVFFSIFTPFAIQKWFIHEQEHIRYQFIKDILFFDNHRNSSSWLDKIQSNFSCCGYNGPRDYKEFFKPPSCCDRESNNKENLFDCENPKAYVEGESIKPPVYYTQGCAVPLNEVITRYEWIFIIIGIIGILLMIICSIWLIKFLLSIVKTYFNENRRNKSMACEMTKIIMEIEFDLENLETTNFTTTKSTRLDIEESQSNNNQQSSITIMDGIKLKNKQIDEILSNISETRAKLSRFRIQNIPTEDIN